jgi:UDPglucose 6-dehydrogenase
MDLFVVGAGYVGLTTAVGFSQLGHSVVVHDIDAERLATLAAGHSPIFEAGLEDAIRRGLAEGRLQFTGEAAPPEATDVAIVCVPTPSDPSGLLDSSLVEAVVERLLVELPQDRTIVVRSTLPLHGPERLESIGADGARPALVVNPEFMREGRALADFAAPTRVVVGSITTADRPAAEAFAELYAPLGAPLLVADARSVVMLKLVSNVFLGAKVAFANEVARLCDATGADYAIVADGIGLDPRIGRAFLDAGPGFGGSCLPEQAEAIAVELERRDVDGVLLSSIASSNERHQQAVVATVGRELGRPLRGSRIALLGLAFKANTDDVRRSPALALARMFRAQGADVVGYDPVAAHAAAQADPVLETAKSAADAVAGADVAVVVTEWAEFSTLDWVALAAGMRGDLVYDSRRTVAPEGVRSAGLRLVGLGGGLGRRPADATPPGRRPHPAAAVSAPAAGQLAPRK